MKKVPINQTDKVPVYDDEGHVLVIATRSYIHKALKTGDAVRGEDGNIRVGNLAVTAATEEEIRAIKHRLHMKAEKEKAGRARRTRR